jgi:hypothetical protein
MGLFDGQGLGSAPETLGDMYRGVARGVGTGLIDPYMEGKGFTSKENQILTAMKGVDLTNAQSVSDTFNKIMQIDPQSAAEFQKQVMPLLKQNQTAASASKTDLSNLGKHYRDAANVLKCDINDPECFKKAHELVVKFKKPESSVTAAFGEGYGKLVLESFDEAEQAVKSLHTIETGLDLLDEGIHSGAFAKTQNAAHAILNKIGLTKNNSVSSTQAYTATLGSLVGQIIKQFGSGTGLSDADREYALGIAGGNVTFDERALRKILDIQKRVNLAIIANHNKKVADLPAGALATAGLGDTTLLIDPPQLKERAALRPEGAIKGTDEATGTVIWKYPDGKYYTADGKEFIPPTE